MKAADIDLARMLSFDPARGEIRLADQRMLLFSQRSMGLLEDLLATHLGRDFSSAVFAQFGYRCGTEDYQVLSAMADWDTDEDRLASGPVMHQWEGLVKVEPTHVSYDRGTGHFRMTGRWLHSFEAANHLATHGRADAPVCATLTGYASGWATAFFGAPLLAIETMCEGKGDPHCAFEIRPVDAWGPEADPWRQALEATDRSLAGVLERRVEERTRTLSEFKAALDHHALVAITNPLGVITYVNDRFCEVSQYARADLIGQNHSVVNSGFHGPEFWRQMWCTVKAGDVWHGEVCNRAKDGSLHWLDTTIVPLPDESGEYTQFIALRTDITARKQAEAALLIERDRASALAEAAREASRHKSEFLATMSHEIRTPMNGVLGFADLLLGTGLDDEQRPLAETIRTSGQSLLAVINDILDFSKVEAGHLKLEALPFAPRAVVTDVVGLLSAAAGTKRLTIGAVVEPDVPEMLTGDLTRVTQVLTNLVGNAVKFTDRGSVTVRVSRDGTHVRFAVQDTGIGVPDAARDRLFDQFTQADSSTTRRYGGTGLGLAIVKRLAQAMGGEVGLDSEVGVGSTFWFTLPCDVVQPSARAGAPGAREFLQPAHAAPSSVADVAGRTALVVDDNPVNQVLARKLLERLGMLVDVADDGRQAVARLADRTFDIVLMDCHMPVMDGFEATRRIRHHEATSRRPRVSIVALTASVLDADRALCLAAGMDDLVAKPIAWPALCAALDRWCRKAA